jgi:citrate lyase subunit beta / citryl-CoA lyase
MCMLDLEDSVASNEKEAARKKVVEAIRSSDWGDKIVGVRVNSWGTEWTYGDLIEVACGAGERLDEVVLPKTESPADVHAADRLLTQVEKAAGLKPGRIGLQAQIESARALSNVAAICAASTRLVGVIFGPADFAASMGIPAIGGVGNHRQHSVWLDHALVEIAVAARAAGLQVIDGPYFKLGDLDGLSASCELSAGLGYDGKWAIHPDQLQAINEAYTPAQELFDRAWDLIEAYSATTEDQRAGSTVHEGEMIDEASRSMAAQLVKRGERAGLVRVIRRPR